MKILLTGKSGQIGFELQRTLAPVAEVVAVSSRECNLADGAALRALVRAVKPDVIVNPAAYTAVDRAESEPALAEAVNATAPGILAEEAAGLGALLIHFSTDYVFDGQKSAPYTETDEPNSQNIYGETKLAGERAIAASGARHLILRTSWVVGAHGNNFAKTMLRLAAERESLRVVADQFGAPTSARLLADITAHLIIHSTRQPDHQGVFHVAAGGETNWCDYARHVIAYAEAAGHIIKAKPADIHPITSADYPTPARRPANSRLDCTKFKKTFGLILPPWQQGLDHILQQIIPIKQS